MAPELVVMNAESKRNSSLTHATLNEVDDKIPRNKRGCHLRWSRITKEVEVKEIVTGLVRSSISASTLDASKGGSNKKVILNEVSGSAAPGEILALMGPSGSGKTSLLDVLSGRSSYDSGTITMDGIEVTGTVMKRLKRKVAYVKQADIFFSHLTVRDQLTYTALLRLPREYSKTRMHAEVNRTLQQLRLTKCADTPIFMVSGGERKRVNIGTELLTDPSVVILDEPTSGLDSTSAVALLRMLHSLATEDGKTILTSIHQPSSAVFAGFDKVLFLGDGHMIYYGTPLDSLSHLRNNGFDCPGGYNAADHWMDLLVIDSAVQDENDEGPFGRPSIAAKDDVEKGEGMAPGLERRKRRAKAAMGNTPRSQLIDLWDNDAYAEEIDLEVLNLDTDASAIVAEDTEVERKFNSTWFTQFKVLVHRSMKNSRSAIFTPLNLIKSACVGVMAGLLWFQMPYTEKTVVDRSSYYFFTMTFWVFDAMFTAQMAFPNERAIIFKERASGAYHLSAYFMAKTFSEAPTRLILPAIYMVISYWMAGLNNNFGIFLGSTCITLLSVMTGESLGLMVGASVMDFEKGMVIMVVSSLTLMIVGGFFVDNLPPFVAWLKFISPFKYAFDASQQMVFDRNVPCDGSGVLKVCSEAGVEYATPTQVIEALRVQGSVGFNVGLLIVVFLIPRYIAFLSLKNKKAGERS